MKDIELPSLPFDLSYPDLIYKTNRGFLARKIGQYAGLDTRKWDSLLYKSLTQTSFNDLNENSEVDLILYLSSLMLEFKKEQEDIVEQVKSLDINVNLQNAMLKAYEIHKSDLFLPTSTTQKHEKIEGKEQSEWKIYQDVIFAATQGQFLLIMEDEVETYKAGNVFCEGTIQHRSDIPICRNAAKECFEQMGLNKSKMMSWLLVLSEAITNTIKHAEEGKMTLVENIQNNEICFVIEDKGPGFPLEELPKRTLLAGYSTKKSLGQGFTLMMKIARKILLCTTPKGSTLILIVDVGNGKEERKNEHG